jgi:hypothetical protein
MPRGRASDPVERLREICLALPEMSERLSQGEPAWFVRGKKTDECGSAATDRRLRGEKINPLEGRAV